MKYKLHIAYANREDLAREAIDSARDIGNIHLWPNGGAEALDGVSVTKQTVLPLLTPVCVINMMIQSSWDDDVMFWMHNDAFARPGVAADFLKSVEALAASDKKWGVCFTTYDVLCAFNMKAVREVGYWDPMFFQYTADPDYYHRLTAGGWELLNWEKAHEGGVEHRGSMTVRSDKLFNHFVQWRERDKFDKRYYAFKWGGSIAHETFKTPFEDVNSGSGLKA